MSKTHIGAYYLHQTSTLVIVLKNLKQRCQMNLNNKIIGLMKDYKCVRCGLSKDKDPKAVAEAERVQTWINEDIKRRKKQ